MNKLSTSSSPVRRSPTCSHLCNIYRVVHKAELLIRSLMLEGISILLTEVHDEIDDLRRSVWNLDGVSLDMDYLETLLLDGVLEFHHEQSTTLCHDVIRISRITEQVVEMS